MCLKCPSLKCIATGNPFEWLAMVVTWTCMPFQPDKEMMAIDCLDRHMTNYDGMAKRARFKYVLCKLIQIVAGGLVPLFASLGDEWRFWTGTFGVLSGVAGGVDGISQYREKWTRWRRAWQRLLIYRQEYIYKTVDPFKGENRDAELMTRVNRVLNDEFDDWHEKNDPNDGDKPDK